MIKKLDKSVYNAMGMIPYLSSLKYPTLIATTPSVYGEYAYARLLHFNLKLSSIVFDEGIGLVRVKEDAIDVIYNAPDMYLFHSLIGVYIISKESSSISKGIFSVA